MEAISLEEAVEQILLHVKEINDIEEVNLLESGGRILAEDMAAAFDNPPFDRSPVDGYACRSEDLISASQNAPVTLKVVDKIYAGMYSERIIEKGEAARIMTGAPIPQGCDCCIRQEDTDYGKDYVNIFTTSSEWGNYCFHGEDFKKGAVLLKRGMKLGFAECSVLAGMGISRVPVYRLPKIALLTSGDEVIEPGRPLSPGKIYNSNQTMLIVRIAEFGMQPTIIKTTKDDPAAMAEELKKSALESDLIITTGGVSVGEKDIMHEALAMINAERIFWSVNMKPGMPTLFSMYGQLPIISLSGNPFGVAVTMETMVRPAIAKMKRDDSLKIKRVKGIMANSLEKVGRNRRFVRAYYQDGKLYLPDGLHSNGVISSMAGCNCLIDIPLGSPKPIEGTEFEALLF